MRPLPLRTRGWLTEGIVLAAIPVMAYVLAFGFEYGYYIAYRFPQELISVDLNRVFVAGVIFLAGVLFVVILATLALALLPSDHPLARAVAQALTFVLLYLVFLTYEGRFDVFGKILGLALVAYLLYKFAVPVVTQRDVVGYVHKYQHQEEAKQLHPTLLRAMLHAIGPLPATILAYFCIAVILSVTLGWYLATEQVYYFVVAGPPEQVVLRIYGDSLILAQLDRPSRQILRQYTVLRRTTATVTLREERIGPLTVEP
ncbi:MAG TPA: hypothetical protein VK201_06950 [bacterium]|nr:hypothetical protein [bacterium]